MQAVNEIRILSQIIYSPHARKIETKVDNSFNYGVEFQGGLYVDIGSRVKIISQFGPKPTLCREET